LKTFNFHYLTQAKVKVGPLTTLSLIPPGTREKKNKIVNRVIIA
jgi:hypothetical protein